MAYRSFALQQAERAKNVVIPTPQFADLTVRPRYPGEGVIEFKSVVIDIECSPLDEGRVRCDGKRNGLLEDNAT
jgi:hypothetical protein